MNLLLEQSTGESLVRSTGVHLLLIYLIDTQLYYGIRVVLGMCILEEYSRISVSVCKSPLGLILVSIKGFAEARFNVDNTI